MPESADAACAGGAGETASAAVHAANSAGTGFTRERGWDSLEPVGTARTRRDRKGFPVKVVFIANPTAGRGRTRSRVEAYAGALEPPADILWTQGPGHARDLARRAAADCDVICIAGGDGTVSEVVNGLMPRPAPIVVLPTGSGNDFASLAATARSPWELRRMLEEGAGLFFDVIECGDRYGANSVGIGFEAMVTYHSRSIHRLRGLPLYLAAVFRALASFESIRYTIRVDGGEPIEGEFLLISAGNGVRAGGGFRLHPGAYPDDGIIDLCTARRMSRARMLAVLPHAIRGRHIGRPGIDTLRGTAITVSAAVPFPVHIDGEYLGRLSRPLTLSVLKRRLPVLCRREGEARRTGDLEQILPRRKESGA
jgi:YegS/Rv2252/BmrU family lipid kinase